MVISLPITEYLPNIHSCLECENKLVLQAEPGAGKSTALPLSLLDSQWLRGKKILMLEPRRVAAKSIAHFLASQLGEKVGNTVGYQIKNERKVSESTVLEVVTEGILTRRLQSDPEIADIGLVIFDEFHERSLHADLSLLLALEIQQSIREDLKLLLMSATIDTALVSEYMGGAQVIDCPGRAYPVELDYVAMGAGSLSQSVTQALRDLFARKIGGDILVFLPSQAAINRCIADAKALLNTDPSVLLLPLYGGLSLAQQEKAIQADAQGRRRIIFATNIAETSLTIDGITCVVDSGLEKVLVYDAASSMTRLETISISKSSAEQRKGRAGRTQPGYCLRLWNKQKQGTLRDYQDEEIKSSDLSGMVLELAIWGNANFDKINWLTPPPKTHFLAAQTTLSFLGLLDSDNQVTDLGKKAAVIGLSPRLATMLVKAESDIDKNIAVELAALLADRDLFHQHQSVDIIDRLLALQEYKTSHRAALENYPIRPYAIEPLLKNANALRRALKIKPSSKVFTLDQLQSAVAKLLLYSFPDRLAKKRVGDDCKYQLANGKGVILNISDSLFGAQWLLVADCDGQKTEGRIYSAAAISDELVLDRLADKFVETDIFEFDQTKGKVVGRKIVNFGALQIKVSQLSSIPPEKFRECLLQVFQRQGLSILNWTSQCEEWLLRAQWLGRHLDPFPKISESILVDSIDTWLMPYLSEVNTIAGLKNIQVFDLLQGVLSWEEQQLLKSEAPVKYLTPSSKEIRIDYSTQQGPTVSVQLQEMFGELNSPKIGGGKVSIRFELLSPARRPIQTTSDLAYFWQNSYFAVAKEMRGRYPRHRWPEQPLLEKAGRSIKPKKSTTRN